ncbi:hypothetical protein ACI0X9_003966 [Cronobacter turicensis]
MSYEIMPYISLAMFAMLFYCFSLIRFLAPLWIILFVISSGRVATPFGLVTVLAFAVVLMFFVLNLIRIQQKKAAKARKGEDHDAVSIFDDEDTESASDLPFMSAVRDDDDLPRKAVKPKKSSLTIYEGTLMSHGFAPYNDVAGNDKSYFVECDDKKVWGIGLKDAVKASGAQNGDTVRFWKEAEVRTKVANVFDSNGKVTGTRNLSTDKRRGMWVMQKVSS